MLNKAIIIAIKAHAGQLDKCGEPYVLHPLRVMLTRSSELERICGVLHDVVEDSDIKLEDLRREGFSDEIVNIIDCLTKRKGEKYEDFISRVLTNETACRIKLSDINDNMDVTRLQCYSDGDLERIERYKVAKRRILDHLFHITSAT